MVCLFFLSILIQPISFFNAAQPGVGRVQVIGSKSLEADFLATKLLKVDLRAQHVGSSEWKALEGVTSPGARRLPSQRGPQPKGSPTQS